MDALKGFINSVQSRGNASRYFNASRQNEDTTALRNGHPLERPTSMMSLESVTRGSAGMRGLRAPPKQWLPVYLRPWFVGTLLSGMVCMAIAIQVATYKSEKHQGWNAFGIASFGGINFLKSAVPVVLTSPVAIMFTKIDQALSGMHPYVALANGRVPAERSLLVSYSGGRISTMLKALRNNHMLVLFSGLICLTTSVLSPLASGILTSRGAPVQVLNVPVASVKSLGVIPDVENLQSFLGAAGFATAAAIQNLSDPSFVLGSWAVAPFIIPPQSGPGANGTVHVPTYAIQTDSNCGNATQTTLTQTSPGQWQVQSAWESCTISLNFTATTQDVYGVNPVPLCTAAGMANQPPQFQPVLFWFFAASSQTIGLTFCQPQSTAYNVIASVDLGSGKLVDAAVQNQPIPANNFTGPPLNGQVYNGAVFNLTDADTLTQARALAIQTALPDAIYQATRGYPGGLDAMIANDFGQPLTDLTNRTYSQFLSLAAQSTYFLDQPSTITSSITNWEIRLWVYPLAAHAFTAAIILIALMALLVHLAHAKARKHVYLSLDPSTMAATLSMTSSSTFPRLLEAGDDDKAVSRKLRGLTFGISRRTWQITADGEEEIAFYGSGVDAAMHQQEQEHDMKGGARSSYYDPSASTASLPLLGPGMPTPSTASYPPQTAVDPWQQQPH